MKSGMKITLYWSLKLPIFFSQRHRQGPSPNAQGAPGPSHHHHHHLHHHNQPGPSRHSGGAAAAVPERPKGGAKRSSRAYSDDPPPPYPGNPRPLSSSNPGNSVTPVNRSGPTRHGYGEGRGHYNRPKG